VRGLAADHHAQRHHRVAPLGQRLGDHRQLHRTGHPGHHHVVHAARLRRLLRPVDHVVDQVRVPARADDAELQPGRVDGLQVRISEASHNAPL
jgi:hypothetical protein